jgi:hypothetical protein
MKIIRPDPTLPTALVNAIKQTELCNMAPVAREIAGQWEHVIAVTLVDDTTRHVLWAGDSTAIVRNVHAVLLYPNGVRPSEATVNIGNGFVPIECGQILNGTVACVVRNGIVLEIVQL